jgi:hypothetical protein
MCHPWASGERIGLRVSTPTYINNTRCASISDPSTSPGHLVYDIASAAGLFFFLQVVSRCNEVHADGLPVSHLHQHTKLREQCSAPVRLA